MSGCILLGVCGFSTLSQSIFRIDFLVLESGIWSRIVVVTLNDQIHERQRTPVLRQEAGQMRSRTGSFSIIVWRLFEQIIPVSDPKVIGLLWNDLTIQCSCDMIE